MTEPRCGDAVFRCDGSNFSRPFTGRPRGHLHVGSKAREPCRTSTRAFPADSHALHADRRDHDLPAKYSTFLRFCISLGILAFLAFVAIFWLMATRPA
ncbi:DUF2269 family protein [Noviherbaspirillum galbum]|uniref:DUF2269 family protein n=1 Tax=Noviherbaspirillum galbum TaxID=2709383 RepID=A0A6B3SXR5_9BURK|nr:DUF2269 family protein [Noviherbaspirillum galbum]